MRIGTSIWSCAVMAAAVAFAHTASAQSYTGDARKVALGGVVDAGDIAAGMVAPLERSTVIPVPIGLVQLVKSLPTFDPSSDRFDPVRAVQTAAGPIHYTAGNGTQTGGGASFVTALVNGELNRDLSAYRVFLLPDSLAARGLASPAFGRTIKVLHSANGGYQGVFVGAGPYASFETDLGVDPRLTEILSSEQPVTYRNASLDTHDRTAIQLALAVIGGYRAHFATSTSSARDGLYVAVNYRHLKGFRYFEPTLRLRFDTDAAGLLATKPSASAAVIDDVQSTSGTGRAIDIGADLVRGRWQAGVGVNGIGNRIVWNNVTSRRFVRSTLLDGADFVEQPMAPGGGDLTVALPVASTGHVRFDADRWAFTTTAASGYNGGSFHGGIERRLGTIVLRGGGRYARDRWEPTGGVGLGEKVKLDLAVYGTHSNVESERRLAMAVSIRIDHGR